MKNKLLIVGTMAYDSIETPLNKAEYILGGSGVYTSLAASNYSVDCGLVSVVGGDFEEKHLDAIQKRGVDISGVFIDKKEKTFFWKGKYHNDMNERTTLDTQLNVLEKFDPQVPTNYKDVDVLMLGNLHPSIQQNILEQMERRPKIVVLDTMNFWIEKTFGWLENILKKVDIVSINDDEARQFSGEYSLIKAAKKIQKLGPQYVIIKKGEHGALLFASDGIFFAPALPLEEVIDPTGAGDSFAGGMVGFLTQNQEVNFANLKRAIIYGSVLASFTVEKMGTDNLFALTPQKIERRLQMFKALTQFEM